MNAVWYWEAVFKDTEGRFWKVCSSCAFVSQDRAVSHLNDSISDGSIAIAGVPAGSKLVLAEAILENKHET